MPSGHDPANYVTRRIFANAPDGARVPVTLLYRKGTLLDGTAPMPAGPTVKLSMGMGGNNAAVVLTGA